MVNRRRRWYYAKDVFLGAYIFTATNHFIHFIHFSDHTDTHYHNIATDYEIRTLLKKAAGPCDERGHGARAVG